MRIIGSVVGESHDQPEFRFVGDKFVDGCGLARPVRNTIFIEQDNAAARNPVPQGVQCRLCRLVKIAVEMHEGEANPRAVPDKLGYRFLNVALDQFHTRLGFVSQVRFFETA